MRIKSKLEVSPEQKFLVAILKRSFVDALYNGKRTIASKEDRDNSKLLYESAKGMWQQHFNFLCETIGFDPQALRRKYHKIKGSRHRNNLNLIQGIFDEIIKQLIA